MTDKIQSVIQKHEHTLCWDGDNSDFVVNHLLPVMDLHAEVRQVVRWAYGFDSTIVSWEAFSDGSSVVIDHFLNGIIKEPPGVGHDWLYHLLKTQTPDPSKHFWTRKEADKWYYRACRDFGYSKLSAKIRYAGLRLFGWMFC